MIEIKGLRKEYSSTVTIGEIDLTIPAGGITALVGPNGAGKSTMLTIVGRLLGADAGTIEIAGYDVSSTNRRTSRRSSPSSARRTTSSPD